MLKSVIIIISDNDEVGPILCELLQEEGYETYSAESLDSGRDVLHTKLLGPPACIIIDLFFELVEFTAFISSLKQITPVLVTTTYKELEQLDLSFPLTEIRKPFSIDQFFDALNLAMTKLELLS